MQCCKAKKKLPAAGQPCGKDLKTSSTHDTKVVSATASFCKMSRSYATALCKGLSLRSSPFAAPLAKQLYFPMSTCISCASRADFASVYLHSIHQAHAISYNYLTKVRHSLPRVSSPAKTDDCQLQASCTNRRRPPGCLEHGLFAGGAAVSGKLELACLSARSGKPAVMLQL